MIHADQQANQREHRCSASSPKLQHQWSMPAQQCFRDHQHGQRHKGSDRKGQAPDPVGTSQPLEQADCHQSGHDLQRKQKPPRDCCAGLLHTQDLRKQRQTYQARKRDNAIGNQCGRNGCHVIKRRKKRVTRGRSKAALIALRGCSTRAA
jgi:hypothetical protein